MADWEEQRQNTIVPAITHLESIQLHNRKSISKEESMDFSENTKMMGQERPSLEEASLELR